MISILMNKGGFDLGAKLRLGKRQSTLAAAPAGAAGRTRQGFEGEEIVWVCKNGKEGIGHLGGCAGSESICGRKLATFSWWYPHHYFVVPGSRCRAAFCTSLSCPPFSSAVGMRNMPI